MPTPLIGLAILATAILIFTQFPTFFMPGKARRMEAAIIAQLTRATRPVSAAELRTDTFIALQLWAFNLANHWVYDAVIQKLILANKIAYTHDDDVPREEADKTLVHDSPLYFRNYAAFSLNRSTTCV